MADEAEQNKPETVKKPKKVLAHLGVVEVEGAGIKVFLDRDIVSGYHTPNLTLSTST